MRIIWGALFIASVFVVWFFLKLPGHAAGHEDSPLKPWFDSLVSKRGGCCSFADGRAIEDPDIDMDSSHYRVRIDGEWIVVPDDALVTVPNKYGQAVVWPYKDYQGKTQIRCFLPGSGV